jgi:hypoxanthine phosphoribosyltransferase
VPHIVRIHDRTFHPFISETQLSERIARIAEEIETGYGTKTPLFVAILNGAFMFAADLFKHFTFDCNITFVKIASYSGTQSTGHVASLIGLNESLAGRHVIILEDIVDTGRTLAALLPELRALRPASVSVVTLLSKSEAREVDVPVDIIGFEIPNVFVVGFGLDYDGLGRNLRAVYRVD